MDRIGINYLYLIFIILMFLSTWCNCSSASEDPGMIIAPPPSNSSIGFEVAPLSSVSSVGGGGSSGGSGVSGGESKKDGEDGDVGLSKRNDTSSLDLDGRDRKGGSLADPPVGTEEKAKGKKDGDGEGGEGGSAKAGIDKSRSCEGSAYLCSNQTMIACVQGFRNDSKDVSVVVQNVGEDILKVHINILPPVQNALPDLQLQKHESKLINITLDTRKSSKVILNAGNSECVFQLGRPVSVEDFLQQLSIYSKQVTPLYGAYGFFLVALLFGGTWACCRLRKRGVQGGVQYQELEMGLPESAFVNVESTEGWDEDWDDDWDEDDIVKSSSARPGGSVSADGLTSRASRTDGWENDWGD